MIDELDRLDGLGERLMERSRAAGVMAIWRAQRRRIRRVVVRQGRIESTSVASASGHNVQVLTEGGRSAFGCRDDFREDRADALLRRVIDAARGGRRLGLHAGPDLELSPTAGRAIPADLEAFDRLDLSEVGRRLVEVYGELEPDASGLSLSLGFSADVDAWRVKRSDGTDVVFAMPRCVLRFAATSTDASRHTVGASVSSPRPRLPWDEPALEVFHQRVLRAAALARALPDAPPHPAGTFPLVIDYALAKGLAHEAFGHAAEADAYRSSVLARDGRLRRGDRVGPSGLSIVDEPVEGDHAWQPFSANGVRRGPVRIVESGHLLEGLSDPWSAGPGGVPLTGAGRAESFRHAPLPRMSNIRIEASDPLPAEGRFEDYSAERVRSLLRSAGVLRRHPSVAWLSGYSGGQVNTATGDFVFNCKAIYRIDGRGVRLHKPAIFSGSMFGALGSIREAFGPLKLDAIGTCGKWGQSIPSSGGSHYFLVVDPHPSVRLGGS